MKCEEITPLLARRDRNRLPEDVRRALDDHLADCASCRESAAAQDEVALVLSSRRDAAAPAGFAARVSQRIAAESGWFAVADWRWLSVRLAPVAAALLILAGVIADRQAASTEEVSIGSVVQAWVAPETDQVPVSSVLWQPAGNDDSALLTVLTAPPDATTVRQGHE